MVAMAHACSAARHVTSRGMDVLYDRHSRYPHCAGLSKDRRGTLERSCAAGARTASTPLRGGAAELILRNTGSFDCPGRVANWLPRSTTAPF